MKSFPQQLLATAVKGQLRDERDLVQQQPLKKPTRRHPESKADAYQSLGRRVSSKLEEGDLKGAVRLACSEDRLANFSDDTFTALQSKHPAPHPDSSIPSPPMTASNHFVVEEAAVARAMKSFPNGSSGGPDKLRPQHLKDMIQGFGEEVSPLLSSLAAFCSLVLEGEQLLQCVLSSLALPW